MMRKITLTVTTDTGGDGTTTSTQNVLGKLVAILYKPGTLATGADLAITCEGIFSHPLLTKSNAGTSDTLYYPRDLVHGAEDGAALTGTSGGDRCLPLLHGSPKVVVAQGGNTLTGSVIFYYEV